MGLLRIMSRNGDDQITWDTTQVEVNNPEAPTAVEEAERIFREQRRRGATAFLVQKGHGSVRIDEFDPLADQIVLVAPLTGG